MHHIQVTTPEGTVVTDPIDIGEHHLADALAGYQAALGDPVQLIANVRGTPTAIPMADATDIQLVPAEAPIQPDMLELEEGTA